ncbi:hypothetical protein E6B08_19100 [Pseudomonas putida]|uniref:Uncharacterized protein n=1 Tax=Pseudomonas putida TaxID=303 RepID=A0A4D6X9Y7_PSEPU|nr:hypothetical protein [Pseudomonas putida]QCI13342.1 hypothetical protein E6B08_19100 [Pseudomonas putida]
MAASNEWTEWHLTPRGWERGTEREDFKPTVNRDAPADCVMTCKHSEVMSSSFSPVKSTDHTIWKHSDEQLLSSLLEQYGPAPKHL